MTELIMPVLSKGKHSSPADGGCFMEMASWLAGERWSDSPECTDSVLAHLARCVNDLVSDGRRHELAPLIPAVVGLAVSDPHERRVMQVRTDAFAARQVLDLTDHHRACVEAVEAAEAWVECPCRRHAAAARAIYVSAAAYAPVGRPAAAARAAAWAAGSNYTATRNGSRAVAHAATSVVYAADADDRLIALLSGGIDLWRRHTGHTPAPVDSARWREAVGLVGAV